MQPIVTDFTKLLNVKTPIVAAPMAVAGIVDLAVEAVTAGGFGFYQAAIPVPATESPEKIKSIMSSIRDRLHVPDAEPIPLGVAFIGWILEKEKNPPLHVAAALESRPAAIWFAFGNELGKHVQQVREFDATHASKTLVFVTANTVEQALVAVNEWKVDVLVVQGFEAGGHGSSLSPPISIFLQAVLNAIPNPPPILAAGGIATGAQIASLLTLGASAVVVGTRLLLTTEIARHSKEKTQVLIEAGHGSTVRGMAFDEVRGTLGWPEGLDGRGVANGIIDDLNAGISVEERIKIVKESMAKGETDRLVVWAGQAIGLTNEVKDTQTVIKELHEEAVEALVKARALLGDA